MDKRKKGQTMIYKHYTETKVRAKRTPLKTGDELG
jgi:sRNA-binding regulator protein Hfq